jgi:2-octaprenyl-3-methyl-6-methoxy-1,4-benzoquinol hydroxylase
LDTFDIAIIGGGMVGAAAALGFAQRGCSVVIIEKQLPAPFNNEDGPDIRVSAISLGSQQLLEQLAAWSHIEQMRCCEYQRLAVWEDPRYRTEFVATDAGFTHLGHIVENRVIQLGLLDALKAYDNVTWINDIPRVLSNATKSSKVLSSITFDDGYEIQVNTIIGADGAQSFVRQAIGIGTRGWSYDQQVLALSIQTNRAQQDITWQRFSPSGPTAFLPLYDGYGSLVWYNAGSEVKRLKSLDRTELKQAVIKAFPEDVGDFDILDVASFPITRMHAIQYVKSSVILIGDAAHTINPLAGQGVNLGFKDVKALLYAFDESQKRTQLSSTLFDSEALSQFERSRRFDNESMMTTMDFFYQLFSNDIGPIKFLRNVGLAIADRAGPVKAQVMKHAMGI